MICKRFDKKGQKMSILGTKTPVWQKVTFCHVLGEFRGHHF
jgi:hypothetical protein